MIEIKTDNHDEKLVGRGQFRTTVTALVMCLAFDTQLPKPDPHFFMAVFGELEKALFEQKALSSQHIADEIKQMKEFHERIQNNINKEEYGCH